MKIPVCRPILIICAGLLSIGPSAPIKGQVLSPEDVVRQLSSSEPSALDAAAKEFALTQEVNGPGGKGTVDATCGPFEAVTKRILWGAKGEEVAAIEADSSCVAKFLVVLDRQAGIWHYSGTIALDERYEAPAYSTVSLSLGERPAILVRRNLVDRGTVIQQYNTQIYAFVGSSLRLVFDEPENLSFGLPRYVEEQNSEFRFISPTTDQPYLSIKETRHARVNGRFLTQYHYYSWNRRWQVFSSFSFAP
jgi:hypothetical protein